MKQKKHSKEAERMSTTCNNMIMLFIMVYIKGVGISTW